MEMLVEQGFRVLPGRRADDAGRPVPQRHARRRTRKCRSRWTAPPPSLAQHKADLVLATDPDADRLGAMVPDRNGDWHFLTGNQIAALLTHFKLTKLTQQGRLPPSPIVVSTEVTTSLVTRIARHFKAPDRRQPAGRLQVHRRRALAAGTGRAPTTT